LVCSSWFGFVREREDLAVEVVMLRHEVSVCAARSPGREHGAFANRGGRPRRINAA
jgi:hypothetical protein